MNKSTIKAIKKITMSKYTFIDKKNLLSPYFGEDFGSVLNLRGAIFATPKSEEALIVEGKYVSKTKIVDLEDLKFTKKHTDTLQVMSGGINGSSLYEDKEETEYVSELLKTFVSTKINPIIYHSGGPIYHSNSGISYYPNSNWYGHSKALIPYMADFRNSPKYTSKTYKIEYYGPWKVCSFDNGLSKSVNSIYALKEDYINFIEAFEKELKESGFDFDLEIPDRVFLKPGYCMRFHSNAYDGGGSTQFSAFKQKLPFEAFLIHQLPTLPEFTPYCNRIEQPKKQLIKRL